MKHQRLVLFDIDGTILHGWQLWVECFNHALSACFPGVEFPQNTFNGKTDRQICRELLESVGLCSEQSEVATEAQIDAVIHGYLSRVSEAVSARCSEVEVLPGVNELLTRLREQSGVTVALLTGNVREGARLKLSAVGLEDQFAFGAYGDDHWDRYELPSVAVRRARDEFGLHFQGKQIVIIGDTVHDVQCGRSLGVRSIAVGTGHRVQRSEILEARPDYFFEDLSDTLEVVKAILEERP